MSSDIASFSLSLVFNTKEYMYGRGSLFMSGGISIGIVEELLGKLELGWKGQTSDVVIGIARGEQRITKG